MRDFNLPPEFEAHWDDCDLDVIGGGDWTGILSSTWLGDFELQVPARAKGIPLTDVQRLSIESLCSLTVESLCAARLLIASYYEKTHGKSVEWNKLVICIDWARVPYIANFPTPIAALMFSTVIERCEHLAFIVANEEIVSCVSADDPLVFYGWDNSQYLQRLTDPDHRAIG